MTTSYRIAHVAADSSFWRFFPGQFGYMHDRGLEVHAISGRDPVGVYSDAEDTARVHDVSIDRGINLRADVISIVRLTTLFRKMGPHIVHAHTTKVAAIALIAAKLAGVPILIYHNHVAAALTVGGIRGMFLRVAESVAVKLADVVIFVSPSVRDAAVLGGLCSERKARTVLSVNGVDGQVRFRPTSVARSTIASFRRSNGIPQDATVVGFVGRLTPHKGIPQLVAAWNRVRLDLGNVHLLLVGAADPVHPLPLDVIRQLRSDPSIHCIGFRSDPRTAYAAMDVFVLPSEREGLPSVALEAAAMELPRVITRIPGSIDTCQGGRSELLVNWGDSTGLAEAICKYSRDAKLRVQHGKSARQFVLDVFHQARVWDSMYAIYCELLGEIPPRRPRVGPERTER